MPRMGRRFNLWMAAEDVQPYEEVAKVLGWSTPQVMRQALREFAPVYRKMLAMGLMAQQGQGDQALDMFDSLVGDMMGEGRRMLAESQEVREELSAKNEGDREAS